MPPMRPHKKSRSGCKTCRQRRVKCNEGHPVCTNCARRELECIYPDSVASKFKIEIRNLLSTGGSAPELAASAPREQPQEQHQLRGEAQTPQTPPHLRYPRQEVSLPDSTTSSGAPADVPYLSTFAAHLASGPMPFPLPDIDLTSLSLLHHYTTSTFLTISSNPAVLPILRDSIPRLALKHTFLLYLLFAFSALHIRSLQSPGSPSKAQYLVTATSYYQKALVTLRHALTAADGRARADGNAIFFSSALLIMYAFATPRMDADGLTLKALTWIPLLKGVRGILRGWWGPANNGELAPLLQLRRRGWDAAATTAGVSIDTPSAAERCRNQSWQYHQLPDYISTLHLPIAGTLDAEEVCDAAVSRIYQEAISTLRETWSMLLTAELRIKASFFWPCVLSDDFVNMLLDKRPRALVLLAHYYSLFSMLDDYWWVNGEPAREVGILEGLIDKKWRRGKWLDWPKRILSGPAPGHRDEDMISRSF